MRHYHNVGTQLPFRSLGPLLNGNQPPQNGNIYIMVTFAYIMVTFANIMVTNMVKCSMLVTIMYFSETRNGNFYIMVTCTNFLLSKTNLN